MIGEPLLEIACFNAESALTAQAAGADRIELCEDYAAGGITPSDNLLLKVRSSVTLPLVVMIRPRGGNFVYSGEEISQMERSILFCKENSVDGVVFGVLTPEGEIDKKACSHLIAKARPLPVTFHRAIDICSDTGVALQELIDLGVDRVLTSGGKDGALEGVEQLRSLQEKFGKAIRIMPGGGIRSGTILKLLSSGCNEFHSAAVMSGENADAEEIRAIKRLLSRSGTSRSVK